MIITVKEARKKLGSSAKSMTDEEVERVIHDLEALARLCLDMYLERKAKNLSVNIPNDVVKK